MSIKSPFGPIGGTTGTGGTGLPAGGTTGQIIVKQSSADGDAAWEDRGPVFLPPPDEEDTTGQYFYFGWEDVNGGWLIQRQTRTTSLTVRASIANNSAVPDLATAWPLRETLTYS